MVYHDYIYIYIHIYIYLIVVYMKCVHTVICLLLTCLGYFTNRGLSALGRAGASVRRLDSTGPDLDGGIGRCAVYCLPGRTLWIIFFISFHIYFLICKDHRFKFSVQLSVVLTYSMIFKGGPQKKIEQQAHFNAFPTLLVEVVGALASGKCEHVPQLGSRGPNSTGGATGGAISCGNPTRQWETYI